MNKFTNETLARTFGDTFFEQIIKVKKTSKQTLAVVGVIILALAVCFASWLFVVPILGPIGLLLIFGACWGAYKLISLTSIEYEYIFTNGDLDIDKITAKSARKRVVSIKCQAIERWGKYTPAVRPSTSVKKTYILCDRDDPNAVYFIAPHKTEGLVMVVFSPDERIKAVVEKSVPRTAK